MGTRLPSTAACKKTQNAVVERHGAIWKSHTKAILFEFFVDFSVEGRLLWAIAAVN